MLAWLAAALYAVLVALNLTRLAGVPDRLRRDLASPPASSPAGDPRGLRAAFLLVAGGRWLAGVAASWAPRRR